MEVSQARQGTAWALSPHPHPQSPLPTSCGSCFSHTCGHSAPHWFSRCLRPPLLTSHLDGGTRQDLVPCVFPLLCTLQSSARSLRNKNPVTPASCSLMLAWLPKTPHPWPSLPLSCVTTKLSGLGGKLVHGDKRGPWCQEVLDLKSWLWAK